MRSLAELLDVADLAWPTLRHAIEGAGGRAVVVPVERQVGERCLYALQVTARSTLGALALETGGLLVDGGWLRIFGGGSDCFPDLATVNGLDGRDRTPPPTLLVATDVLGGQFAINGGGLGGEPGEVHYFGPDTLSWTPLGIGHAAWVARVLGRPLDDFYDGLRWPGWQGEVEAVRPDEAISCFPFLFTQQGRDPAAISRRVVPWEELRGVLAEAADQLAAVEDGTTVRIRVEGDTTA